MPSAQAKTTFIDPPSAGKQEAEAAGADAETLETEQEEPASAETIERADAEPDAEARARKMGWHPKDEYERSGRDPTKWVDADEFVRRGENELPVMRERFRKLEKISEKQAKQLDDGNKLLRDLVASNKAQTDKAVKAALSKAEKDRREAIATGDIPETERLSAEIEEHKDALKSPAPPEREVAQEKAIPPQEMLDWIDENPWFNADRAMSALAAQEYGKYLGDKTLTETQRLAKARAEVVRRFPEKFSNQRRNQPGAVESGNGANGHRRKAEKGWTDLPRNDQDIADRLISMGAVKDRAAYLKDYAW